ncbi:uncharacterized protein LOC107269692 [Cephus cinctus]|uniref:Uncharacterized protein LOC107269692 n=1 Tax=Cephus cinctus TaxID=211228 RepID=A0AAJ7FMN1_CEPCN|nr:uncharacterized protein LOC107269692 [Cephus cinctus]
MNEASTTHDVPSRFKKYLKKSSFYCKIVELILLVISIGLIVDPLNSDMEINKNHAAIIYTSICGYILINTIIILSYLLGERQPKKTSIVFSTMGAILSCVAGLILIHDWDTYQDNLISKYSSQYLNQMLSSGIFAILAIPFFILDAYFTNKYQ